MNNLLLNKQQKTQVEKLARLIETLVFNYVRKNNAYFECAESEIKKGNRLCTKLGLNLYELLDYYHPQYNKQLNNKRLCE